MNKPTALPAYNDNNHWMLHDDPHLQSGSPDGVEPVHARRAARHGVSNNILVTRLHLHHTGGGPACGRACPPAARHPTAGACLHGLIRP